MELTVVTVCVLYRPTGNIKIVSRADNFLQICRVVFMEIEYGVNKIDF